MTRTRTPTYPDDPDPALYERLLLSARQAGRCPVWLGPRALDMSGVIELPDDVVGAIDGTDVDAVLVGWWPGPCRSDCPCDEPLPAELPPDPRSSTPDLSGAPETVDSAVTFFGRPRSVETLAVVEADRPADGLAVLGWAGMCNYHPHQDVVRLSAVLRRWEERYGALLVTVDGSRLHLSVAHPPTTDDECRRVAAEHFAFCPDQQDPQDGRFFTLDTYAQRVRGARSWHFWWD